MKMTKVEASVEINKPVRDVFAYASDWRHWEEWREGVSGLKPTTEIERGNDARYAYKALVAGMKFNLETEIHYFKENEGWQGIVNKGFPHKMQWQFEYKASKTNVTYIIEYSPPWFLIGPLLNFFIIKPNWQRMIEKTLNNLKIHLEGPPENKG
jgi:uncharacterized membrane protein